MADLIQSFFTRDLSEPEHEALSKLLEESPEAALRYEELLEKSYLATGLPQPTLPRALRSLPPSGGWGAGLGWIKYLALGLAVLGVALWKFWPEPQVNEVPSAPKAPLLKAPNLSRPGLRPHSPRPPANGSIQAGHELSVVVDVPQKTLVTVRILNAAGGEIRSLYTGFADPGRRTFRWDGLLANGNPADAGYYRIEVQSGSTRQIKVIQIKAEP